MSAAAPPVLEVSDLALEYHSRRGARPACCSGRRRDLLSLDQREIIALVGESGCGKTSFIRAITRLEEPTAGRWSGSTAGTSAISQKAAADVRRDMQVIFQDPFESLEPRLSVFDTVAAVLEDSRHRHRQGTAGQGDRHLGAGRPPSRRGPLAPVPAPALGRATPTCRDRRRHGAGPHLGDRGRARLDAGRVRSGRASCA